MKFLKSHEDTVKLNPTTSSGDHRSPLPLSSTVRIAAIATVAVFGLFCYTVQVFSRGEIRIEGLGVRFEAQLDSQPKQNKTLPDNRK